MQAVINPYKDTKGERVTPKNTSSLCRVVGCPAPQPGSSATRSPPRPPPPEPPRPLLGNSLRHRNGFNRNFKVSHQVAKEPPKPTLFFRGVLRKEGRGEVEGLKIRSGELNREKGGKLIKGRRSSHSSILNF